MKKSNSYAAIAFAFLSFVLFTGCGGSTSSTKVDNSSPSGNSGYYLHGNNCYSTQGQSVDSSNCPSGRTNYSQNGYCYDPSGNNIDGAHCNLTYFLQNGNCRSSDNYNVDMKYCDSKNVGYYQDNGYCIDSSGRQVNGSHCGMEYFLRNGQCHRSSTEQTVSLMNCGDVCYGTYYKFTDSSFFYYWRSVFCDGNCRGRYYTWDWRLVYCQ